MKMSKHNFENIVFEFCEVHLEDVFVCFKAAYREIDLDKEPILFELMEFDGNYVVHSWLNDWDEGQEYIDFYGVYTKDDLINLILMPNSIELIKDRLIETALNCVGVLCDESEVLEGIANRIDLWCEEARK